MQILCITTYSMHTTRMDKYDKDLLRYLQIDSSVSNSSIGDKIGLSTSQVSRRRAKLEADGIICGYQAIVSSTAMGLILNAFIKVRLHAHDKSAATQFKALVGNLSAVRLACSLTGDSDYLLHVRLPDLSALSDFINDELLAHPLVSEVRSDVVLDMVKDDSAIAVD